MVIASKYIADHHKELIDKCPSDGIPGYNEIILLVRAKKRISKRDFRRLDKLVFNDKIGRDKLRQNLKNLMPRSKGKVSRMEEEIDMLRMRVLELEAEIDNLREIKLLDFDDTEIYRLRRLVSKYIHPDVGGSNEVMKQFNAFIDKLLVSVQGI
jgi:hypothetical protein